MATLPELLQTLVDNNGSDLHITTDTPPQIRVHGQLQAARPAVARAGRDQGARLQRAHRRAEEALRGGARARLLVRHPRHRALPLQRLQPARRRRRGLPRHPRADQGLQRARAAGRCSATLAERPRGLVLVTGPTGSRQVDDAGGDDRQDQHRAARAHPHHRGSDRVRPPAQGLPRQPARGAPGHAGLRARRCAPRSARTPTSS